MVVHAHVTNRKDFIDLYMYLLYKRNSIWIHVRLHVNMKIQYITCTCMLDLKHVLVDEYVCAFKIHTANIRMLVISASNLSMTTLNFVMDVHASTYLFFQCLKNVQMWLNHKLIKANKLAPTAHAFMQFIIMW